jgi:RNA polymerase sigma-70 factor (ECF subfamily)
MTTDRRLVDRARTGDMEALACIYRNHKDRLLVLATGLLGDVSAAEDVLHDVFVGFAAGIRGFRLRSSLKAYLATCVANRARDRLRRSSGRAACVEGLEGCPARTADPADSAGNREESGRVWGALSRLSDEQRKAVALRLQGELKFREIAGLLGVSVNTVKSRYRYGIERLRTMLAKEHTR